MTMWRKYFPQLLLALLAFTFITRMARLETPEVYIFDEVYHALTSKLIARDDVRAYEWWNAPVEENTAVDWLHPPLAKYTQATSMLIFGENSFGWRFSSVIFGVLVVWVTARLVLTLFKDERMALLAAFFVSLDGLIFTQSRIAMNDIHVTFLMVLSVWLYSLHFIARKETSDGTITPKLLLATGVATGLAAGTKWSGAFLFPIFALLESAWYGSQIFQRADKKRSVFIKKMLRYIPLYALSFIVIPPLMYVMAYSHMFTQGKGLTHLKDMHQQIWWYQTTLDAEHPYQSRPWEWALNVRPVWYHIEHNEAGDRGDIYAFGNVTLYWLGLVGVVAAALMWVRNIGTKLTKDQVAELHAVGIVLVSYMLSWMPWFASPRIMFFYHYAPAVPFMSILLAFWVMKLWGGSKVHKSVAITCVALVALTFVVWYPHWTGLPVPEWLKENIYFALEQWR